VPSDVFGIVGSVQADAFEVGDVVAEGGFAVVYRAHHRGFRAEVALKCLKIPGALSLEQREGFLEKFREEAEVLFRLSASIPQVVRPLHVGTLALSDDRFVPFIALEWLEGESLGKLVARRKLEKKPLLSLERTVRLLGPVARALERAHAFPGPGGSVSILHRDLKPENVFVARVHGQEQVKILDFGISKVKSAATQIAGQMSAHGDDLAAFTPQYGAPEQWMPHSLGQTGTWTDVWGLAVTCVEVLSGRPALSGDARAIVGAALDEKRRPTPRTLGADVPDRVERAFLKALAVDPRDRFRDVGVFWDEIEAATGVVTPRLSAPSSTFESLPPAPAAASQAPTRIAPPAALPSLPKAAPDAPVDATLPSSQLPPDTPAAPRRRSGAKLPAVEHVAPAPAPVELDGVGLMPAAAEPRVRLRVARAPAAAPPMPVIRGPSPFGRVVPALKLLALAACITLVDVGYVEYTGEALAYGPVRPFWIAGPLTLIALVKVAWVLFTMSE
jgi:serine/threonine-protein kinase